MNRTKTLAIIVISQFCCTSVWFATNAILNDLIVDYGFSAEDIGLLTSSVQLGFIFGTLCFAFFSITDRHSPSKVFFVCAVIAAITNNSIVWFDHTLYSASLSRWATGFFLAGIYPVGMKISADYFEKGLGKSLGFLVGALVLGTAFPHFVQFNMGSVDWRLTIHITTALSLAGGALISFFIPDGPYRKPGLKFNPRVLFTVFESRAFKKAAVGYFGHMWELYTFWVIVPIMLSSLPELRGESLNVSLWSFFIIAIGTPACMVSGYISEKFGTRSTAFLALAGSGICCLTAPLIAQSDSLIFLVFLLTWGSLVIADSPLFSTLVAQTSKPEIKGTSLTIVNCLGFSITIINIQLIVYLNQYVNIMYLTPILSIGPFVGIAYSFSRD